MSRMLDKMAEGRARLAPLPPLLPGTFPRLAEPPAIDVIEDVDGTEWTVLASGTLESLAHDDARPWLSYYTETP